MLNLLEKYYGKIRFGKYEFNFICRVVRYLIRLVVNNIYPLYLKLSPTPSIVNSNINNNIIVSFTSFPNRIDRVWIVVESILRQKLKPEKIILWLSIDQFPHKEIPSNLNQLVSKGLEIHFVENDIRSHKKYFYAIRDFSDSVIVTIDDDIVYPSNFLKVLYSCYLNDKKRVYCKYARRIEVKDGHLDKYSTWKKIHSKDEEERLIFFGSGGGTLFPPHCFYKDITNIELATTLCPIADDIFLNAMVRLKGTKISTIDLNYTFIPMSYDDDERLADSNIESANDIQLNNIISYYKEKGLAIWNI